MILTLTAVHAAPLQSSPMASRITPEEIRHVAKLARLALTDDEVVKLTHEVGAILEHVAQVEALDTADIPPTSHALPMVNVFRPDEIGLSLNREEVLAQAPEVEDNRFRVPRILDEA